MTTVVIMPGGFHPFHPGHLALYQSAQRTFPDAEVYVAATNDKSDRPFDIADKQKIAYAAGVEPGHFVQVKSPFQAMEIASQYDPDRDQIIFVRSEKDVNSPPKPGGVKKDGSPSYLQPLLGAKKLEPFRKHAYMAYLPTVEFGPGAFTSASEIRTAWPKLTPKRKMALVMSLYPSTQKDPTGAKDIVRIFDQTIGGVAENQGWAATYEADGLTAGTGAVGGMHASYQDRYNQPVDEARIHLTDPKTLVNLYYITPKLQAQGKVQNVAHNIPYSTVQLLINRLMQKYPNMNPEYMVWYPLGQDQYGQRLSERDITSKLGTKRDWGKSVRKWRKERGLDEQDYLDEERTDPIEAATVDFYQNRVGNVRPEPVKDYKEIARELLGKTEDPTMREKVMHALVQGNKNPYIQGGIITTVAAIVSGGILTSAARMGLTPQQTNIMLQAILNTVVPTVVSRLNGKSWRDTAKYTLASAGIGTGIAAMTETGRKK